MRLLALDAGGGGGRALVFDERGTLLGARHEPWGYVEPPGLEMIGKEFDPDAFWALMARAARGALAEAGADRVDAVAAAGMRQGTVFLDEAGREVLATPNADARGILYGGAVEEAAGAERLYAITGHYPPWTFAPARLRWLREEAPERFARVAKVLTIGDWITHRLCGRAVAEPAGAGETMLFDFARRGWSPELLEAFALPASLLPALAETGAVAGELGAAAARDLGVAPGAPVVVGACDTQAALLGSGVLAPGALGVVLGSTAPLMAVTAAPVRDPHGELWSGCAAAGGRWVIESNALSAGRLLRWVRDAIAPDGLSEAVRAGRDPYGFLLELAEEAPPGCLGTLAFLGPGPFNLRTLSPTRTGGFLFPELQIERAPNAGALMVRAVLENIAYGVRACAEQIEAALGAPPDSVTLSGGMTRSPLFCTMIAEALGRPVRVARSAETTGLGLAMAMARALGAAGSWEEAAGAMAAPRPGPALDAERARAYADGYAVWRERREALRRLD